ncbi:MAG TPA: SdpI family protein [Pseudonocardia sp.]|nr:SdpI family protein [Pseudonocardia sp.]
MPISVRLVVGVLELLAGVGLLGVAALGARSRLPRNRWAGVRTAATLRTDETFALANRVAALPVGAAGAVAAAGGAALLAGADGPLAWVVLAISAVGTLVLAGVGGVAGDRAAAAVPRGPAQPTGCAGECAGCELVAGCRPAAAPVDAAADQA